MTEIRWLIVAADGGLYHSVVAAAVHAALHKSLAGRKGADGRWPSRAAQTIENEEKPGCERIPIAMRRREGKGREVNKKNPSPSEEEGEGSSSPAGDDAPEGKSRIEKTPLVVPEALLFECVAAWNEMAAGAGLNARGELSDRGSDNVAIIL